LIFEKQTTQAITFFSTILSSPQYTKFGEAVAIVFNASVGIILVSQTETEIDYQQDDVDTKWITRAIIGLILFAVISPSAPPLPHTFFLLYLLFLLLNLLLLLLLLLYADSSSFYVKISYL